MPISYILLKRPWILRTRPLHSGLVSILLKLDGFSENSTRFGSSVGGGDCSGFSGIDTEFGMGDVVSVDVCGNVAGTSDGS